MTERKSNLGNVAMDTCVVCKEPMGIVLQTRDGKDAFDGKREVCTGQICDKCQKTIDENVMLHCETCKGFMVIKAGTFPNMKAGDRYKIYKCIHCTGDDTIEWLPPAEIERQKKESEALEAIKIVSDELTDEEIQAQNDEQDRMQMFKEETES